MAELVGELVGGRAVVAAVAPEAATALDTLEATVWRAADADLVDLAARVCASVHGLGAPARPAALGPSPWAGRDASGWRGWAELTDGQRVALAFAEQFTVDVSAISDGERAALHQALADGAAGWAQALYVVDVVARARFALDRLFGDSATGPAGDTLPSESGLWGPMEDLIRVVPGLLGLDPVTTELVRLRGARQHQCRICQSLRSRAAMVAGADDDTFAAVDDYEASGLSEADKAALAFTDAFVWTPGRIGDEAVPRVRAHFTAAQQVELVLDITRNATNKVAVALAADDPHVSEGYEVYDVASDGTITYGLSRP